MSFRMIHENYNVSDLDRSIKFYGDALDLHEVRRKTTDAFCEYIFRSLRETRRPIAFTILKSYI